MSLMYAYEGVTLGRSPRGRQSVNVIHIGMVLPGTPTPPSELIGYNPCVDASGAPLSKKTENPSDMEQTVRNVQNSA